MSRVLCPGCGRGLALEYRRRTGLDRHGACMPPAELEEPVVVEEVTPSAPSGPRRVEHRITAFLARFAGRPE